MKKLVMLCSSLILFSLIGGAHAADESPETISGATTIDVSEAKSMFDQGTAFIDIRSDKDWTAGRIPDAVHIELKKVFSEETLADEVKKDEPVVFYCNGISCMRSSKASTKAVEWGYTNVYYFRLGYPAWKAAGYPTE